MPPQEPPHIEEPVAQKVPEGPEVKMEDATYQPNTEATVPPLSPKAEETKKEEVVFKMPETTPTKHQQNKSFKRKEAQWILSPSRKSRKSKRLLQLSKLR